MTCRPPLSRWPCEDDDPATIALALEAGFIANDDVAVSCWLNASDRPRVSDLASGYRLLFAAPTNRALRIT